MRHRSATTRFLIGLSTLLGLQGCGCEGIDAPVPTFDVPPNMDLVAGKFVAQAHRLLGDYNAEEVCWKRAGDLAETDSERLNCLGASLQAVGRSGDWVRASSSFDILLEDIPPAKATALWAAAAEAAIKSGRSDRANFYLEQLRSAGFENIVSQLEKIKGPS